MSCVATGGRNASEVVAVLTIIKARAHTSVGCLFRQLHSISSLRWFWLTFHQYINKSLLYGDMLELVDRLLWGGSVRKSMWVRVPLSLPESCERIRLKTLSHSKSRRMHMAPVGANMAPWYNGYYIGLSLRRSGFDSPWSRHRHHRRSKCMVAI